MHNKSIVFRVDKEMYNRIKDTAKTLGVTHSQVIRDALQQQYRPVQTYNQDIITVLKEQIVDLQQQRDMLQQRVDYYSQPWYRRIMTPRLKAH